MAGPQIFISYASKDQAAALEVCEILESEGMTCWIAPRNIRPGRSYAEEILSAIRDCRIVVLLLSSSANESRHVPREIDRAVDQDREILVLRLEDVEARGALEYYLSGRQWLDGFSLPLKSQMGKLSARAREILGLSPPAALPESTELFTVSHDPAVEKPPQGFCLRWSVLDQTATTQVRNAAVLITDHRSLTPSDIASLAIQCQKLARPLVVVGPAFEAAAIHHLTSTGGLAIEAKEVDGNPVEELLEDLAVYLGSCAWLQEFGFGIPQRQNQEEMVNGVVRRFMQVPDVKLEDLGKAAKIWFAGNYICFEAEQSRNHNLDSRVDVLMYRAKHCARSLSESHWLLERLRRFGVVEPIEENVVQPVGFKQTAREMILPAGFSSRYFMEADYRCSLKNAKVLVTGCSLLEGDAVIPALELATKEDQPLAVFAPQIEGPARALLVMNKLRGTVLALAVETDKLEYLSAIASLTGAQLIEKSSANRIPSASVRRALGNAREVVAEFHKTRIVR